MLPRVVAAATLAALLTSSTRAHATNVPTVYDNAQGIPIGSRAAGMGGAYTALACDEASLHYNPASLSCADSSHLELSANAYILQGELTKGALGPGADISATTFHSIPSIVGWVRILREGSERTRFATYPGRLAFGLAVSVPSSIALKIEPPKPSDPNAASFAVRDDLTAFDLGLAYQYSRELAFGVSLGGVLRTTQQDIGWLLAQNTTVNGLSCPAGGCSDHFAYDASRSYLAIGMRAKLAALVRPIKNFSFGAVVTLPTAHIYGSAEEDATLTVATPRGFYAVPVRTTGSSRVDLPLRIATGMAYVKKRYTFTGDISLNFPRTVHVAEGMSLTKIAGLSPQAQAFVTPPAGMSQDRTQDLTFQPNVNLGASIPFGPTKELNLGFFTDFSSVSTTDILVSHADRVHMAGGSMTVGLLGKQSRAWVGVSGEVGHTTTQVPGRGFSYDGLIAAMSAPGYRTGDLPGQGEATLVRWTMVGILGSNYSFLE
jgi:hypothetical protein